MKAAVYFADVEVARAHGICDSIRQGATALDRFKETAVLDFNILNLGQFMYVLEPFNNQD